MPDALALVAEPDGLTLQAWQESRGIARSTARKLLAVAGVETTLERVRSCRVPVTFLPQPALEAMDALADRLHAGETLAQLQQQAAGTITRSSRPELARAGSGSGSRQLEHAHGPDALLARLKAGELALSTGLPVSTTELAYLLGTRPTGDVVQRGRVMARKIGRNAWELLAA
jgi:hypothetical protein